MPRCWHASATAVYYTITDLAKAIEMLLDGSSGLTIVRCKDRLGGNSYGYRDIMLNLKLPNHNHIGELQLHLKTILDIKPVL